MVWSPSCLQLQPPPVRFPRAHSAGPGQDRLFMGWEGDLPGAHLCSLQLCALCPRESPLAVPPVGKEPPPGNSWSDGLNLRRRGSLVARVSSHPPTFPLCQPLPLCSLLPLPHGSQKPSPPITTPGLGSSSPVEPRRLKHSQEHMGLRRTRGRPCQPVKSSQARAPMERSQGQHSPPGSSRLSQT